MSVQPGDTLLHYRIAEKIGEGGMGEVWRARDTTLDRDVAIKLLPGGFASEADRLARFEREAKVLASLNHPQIAAIHGLHEASGQRFLAMELVPGEDLAARLARGPIPVAEAVAIGRKIAEALEYAHERGIIHRDLKPANIKITPDGDVKVLDFGLAKAVEGDPSSSSPTTTPTMMTVTVRGTVAGMILGTAAYMSPEQARGKPVDKRADTWAFGCVLYEMLTGRRLFEGETVTDVLAAVVTREPDWTRLPSSTPAAVRRLLARCLDKDPRTRLRDVGEARIVLEHPDARDEAVPKVEPRTRASGVVMIAAALAALVAGLGIGRYVLAPGRAQTPTYEFDITVSGRTVETGSFALSPDGSRLALVTQETGGDPMLCVRELNAADVRVLPGTNGAEYPFWSPDSREIGYFSGNDLFRIALDGAAARPVASAPGALGGAWGPGDVILFGTMTGPIQRVGASGGMKPEPLTKLEPGEESHAWPAFLPDGKQFLYLADSQETDKHRIYLASLDGGAKTILKQAIRSAPLVDPSGRLLLGERGQLLAYAFDFARGVVGKDSTLVANHIYPTGNRHHLAASASVGGMVASQQSSADMNLVVIDKAGQVTRTLGEPARYGNPRISPNGKRVAFEIFTDTTERLVWVHDIDRGVRTPVSLRGHAADDSAWAPDSETVFFDGNSDKKWEIYRTAVTGGRGPESLGGAGSGDMILLDVSPDGRWVLASAAIDNNAYDLHLRSTASDASKWTAWATGPSTEDSGSFSPDSRWIAYASDASGRMEVYIAPVEGGPAAHHWLISSGGGTEPKFAPDGKTVYYRSPTFEWMAVDVKIARDAVEAATPRKLFSLPPVELGFLRNLMDVLPDGSGFVTIRPAADQAISRAIRIRTTR